MYPNENCASVAPEKKMPFHMEIAEKILNEFSNLNSQEQVEVFKHVQKQLADGRVRQGESMQKEHENYASTIKSHIEGTNIIAGGL